MELSHLEISDVSIVVTSSLPRICSLASIIATTVLIVCGHVTWIYFPREIVCPHAEGG